MSNKIKICPKCNKEFEINERKKGTQFKFCVNCRPSLKPKKYFNCLFCNRPLTHKRKKPFCGWNCELRHNIDIFQKRNKNFKSKLIIGCA